jgi:CheY-like chemotaxis protein
MSVRPDITDPARNEPGGRLNLLLSYGGWDHDPWIDRLPTLLEPFGVRSFKAASGAEATRIIQRFPVHIAVVDLALPLEACDAAPATEEGGARLLDLLARLDQPPPTVVVKRRRPPRQSSRELASALQRGAFAVLEPPVHLETALETMRRVLMRHYADRWPGGRA